MTATSAARRVGRTPSGRLTPMVLPHADANGCVVGRLALHDSRVPPRLSPDYDPEVLSAWPGARCVHGRHTWDVVTASAALTGPGAGALSSALDHGTLPAGLAHNLDGEDDEWRRFRMRLTCIRCGRIESLEGLSRDSARGWARVEPTPLRAGDLVAQQIEAPHGRIGLETWSVHQSSDGEPIGVMTRQRNRLGTDYYRASLHHWPEDAFARGKTPITALRSLARMVRAATSPTDHTNAQQPADAETGEEQP